MSSRVVSTLFPWSSVLLLKAYGCDGSLCPCRLCSLQETWVPYAACEHWPGVRREGGAWLWGTLRADQLLPSLRLWTLKVGCVLKHGDGSKFRLRKIILWIYVSKHIFIVIFSKKLYCKLMQKGAELGFSWQSARQYLCLMKRSLTCPPLNTWPFCSVLNSIPRLKLGLYRGQL